ncbi:DUF2202 domain-containing protein [Thiohalocapsa marina]|uniref:DUF2202 domain-containing protein n=1 Tax=Thiohalocapsa marina TaxID=424902 RepID=A0A5M8FKR1_9GAMM|nr:DUF2202 domain-containing protein [Thiohalocapsa marina]KAA6185319.1 DUF2202 domain-containing protein [Thiohalocapsa marina]
MNVRSIVLPAAIALCIGTAPALARGPNGGPVVPDPALLSPEESATLLWMREEEKLARDVYVALDAEWNLVVLERIAASEQRHFDALGDKIERYGLTDPALPGAGVFSVEELQALYDDLVNAGLASSAEALVIGATIEDLDILDLLHALEETTQPDLTRTYENLLEGSKNHLRAFVRELRLLGLDYEPQYIDPLLFDAIVGV